MISYFKSVSKLRYLITEPMSNDLFTLDNCKSKLKVIYKPKNENNSFKIKSNQINRIFGN